VRTRRIGPRNARSTGPAAGDTDVACRARPRAPASQSGLQLARQSRRGPFRGGLEAIAVVEKRRRLQRTAPSFAVNSAENAGQSSPLVRPGLIERTLESGAGGWAVCMPSSVALLDGTACRANLGARTTSWVLPVRRGRPSAVTTLRSRPQLRHQFRHDACWTAPVAVWTATACRARRHTRGRGAAITSLGNATGGPVRSRCLCREASGPTGLTLALGNRHDHRTQPMRFALSGQCTERCLN